jgi:RNA polymerase sigma factor (sigma-70 family)
MSLDLVSDRYLATRAADGDEFAFAELARRYRRLIRKASRNPPLPGVEVDDLRQEALLGLLVTCRRYDPARGPFAALARLCVRQRVHQARRDVLARKHLVLTDALRDGDEPRHQLAERAPAPAGWNPSVVVELRDELRRRVEPRRDRRRRYSDEQIERALALIAEGQTLKQTAFAVGAPIDRVARWVRRAGMRHAGRRRYTPEEIVRAVSLVRAGATQRQAGAAVGATNASVCRWLRKGA